jgi:hypothetical protein
MDLSTLSPDRGIPFVRVMRSLYLAGGGLHAALQHAESTYGPQSRPALALRAAVAAGTTTDGLWASNLAEPRLLADEFIGAVRPMTILGRIAGLRRVPENVKVGVMATGTVAHWVGQGQSKPVSKAALDQVTLEPRKIVGLCVLAQELLRAGTPAADALLRTDLARAVAKLADQTFIDPSNAGVAGESPASVLHLAPNRASTGDVASDLDGLLTDYQGSLETAVVIAHPRVAVGAAMQAGGPSHGAGLGIDLGARGGTLAGLPVVTSESVPAGTLAILDAAQVLLAEGTLAMRISTQATLELDDAPAGDETGTYVNLWQANLVGMLAELSIHWELANADAACYVTGATYSSYS